MTLTEAKKIAGEIRESLGTKYPELQYLSAIGFKKKLLDNGKYLVARLVFNKYNQTSEIREVGIFKKHEILENCVKFGFDYHPILNCEDPDRDAASTLGNDRNDNRCYEPRFN